MTHIRKTAGKKKTLCGLPVSGRPGAKQTIEAERVLDWEAWLTDLDETCVSCESSLETNGLTGRG